DAMDARAIWRFGHRAVNTWVAKRSSFERMSSVPTLEGWGRLPRPGREVLSTDLEAVTRGATLSRGLGRSYGDASLPAGAGGEVGRGGPAAVSRGATPGRGLRRSYGDASLPARAGDKVAATRLADRILAFDARTGVLRAEAGLSLAELNRVFIPRGFFPPVT